MFAPRDTLLDSRNIRKLQLNEENSFVLTAVFPRTATLCNRLFNLLNSLILPCQDKGKSLTLIIISQSLLFTHYTSIRFLRQPLYSKPFKRYTVQHLLKKLSEEAYHVLNKTNVSKCFMRQDEVQLKNTKNTFRHTRRYIFRFIFNV